MVELSPMGASVQRFLVPNRHGNLVNIILSPGDAMAPRSACAYAGAIIGPVAGRIRDGIIAVNGKLLQLDQNDGRNHLHGGMHGLSDAVWEIKRADPKIVVFVLELQDGLDGYPGQRTFEVCYSLDNENTLSLAMTANSNQPTLLNPSTHIYWNLSGDLAQPIANHLLQIAADMVVFNREDHTMENLQSVENTIYDFRIPKPINIAIEGRSHPQMEISRGLNNLFVLQKSARGASIAPQLSLFHPTSRRKLTVSTSLPCQWVYSGGYLDSRIRLENGNVGSPGLAIAFEPQRTHPAHENGGFIQTNGSTSHYREWIDFTITM